MFRIVCSSILCAFLLVACSDSSSSSQVSSAQSENATMVVYQSPQCGCCEDWITYMKQTGFEVKEQVKTAQMNEVKEKFHIPQEAMGCHTAVIGDYAVEGHVPPQEVRRLLQERPSAVGIAVAGMPMGSYGMDYDSREEQYDVLLILPEGKTEVYATYKGKNKIENAESSNSKD